MAMLLDLNLEESSLIYLSFSSLEILRRKESQVRCMLKKYRQHQQHPSILEIKNDDFLGKCCVQFLCPICILQIGPVSVNVLLGNQ